jgi:hypothetical protein
MIAGTVTSAGANQDRIGFAGCVTVWTALSALMLT